MAYVSQENYGSVFAALNEAIQGTTLSYVSKLYGSELLADIEDHAGEALEDWVLDAINNHRSILNQAWGEDAYGVFRCDQVHYDDPALATYTPIALDPTSIPPISPPLALEDVLSQIVASDLGRYVFGVIHQQIYDVYHSRLLLGQSGYLTWAQRDPLSFNYGTSEHAFTVEMPQYANEVYIHRWAPEWIPPTEDDWVDVNSQAQTCIKPFMLGAGIRGVYGGVVGAIARKLTLDFTPFISWADKVRIYLFAKTWTGGILKTPWGDETDFLTYNWPNVRNIRVYDISEENAVLNFEIEGNFPYEDQGAVHLYIKLLGDLAT